MAPMSTGRTPRVWAASTRKKMPRARHRAPTAPMGNRVPDTLEAWVSTTARTPGVSRSARFSVTSSPRSVQGRYSTSTPARSSWRRGRRTALCSMGEVTTRSPGRSSPLSSRFSPWVAPEVNATLRGPGPFTRVQSRSRTSSTPPAAS